jgi:hypothetical protein
MKYFNPAERRKFTRFNIHIPLKYSLPTAETEQIFDATSINVCLNGVYCTVNHYIPLFDRLLVTFVSPKHNGIPAHIVSQLEGIVVRVEPEQEEAGRTEYNIALFFQKVSQQQHEALHKMITSHTTIV